MKRFQHFHFFLVIWTITGVLSTRAQPIIIGYTNCVAVPNYSSSTMSQIGQLKWYIAHASVGECMMEGLTNLHNAQPGFYQLQGVATTNTPPKSTTNGIIYHDYRGNLAGNGDYSGDWQWKVSYFQTAVSNGWHYPTVNVAMTKFCFIDIWYATSSNALKTLFNTYISSMTNLEAVFPQTKFVYATMPVTMTNYSYESLDSEPTCDYWRAVFNDDLRAWCIANNRMLFDIADIEAHSTNGIPYSFVFDSLTCQQLWPGDNVGGDQCCGEVGDYAHPTNLGAEELLAQGFYALSAAVVGSQVTPASTTTALTSSANPSAYGQSVTLTATVSASGSIPTGVVLFLTNGIAAGAAVMLSGGSASSTLSGLMVGTNSVMAVYAGASGFLASSNSMAQVVTRWTGILRVAAVTNGQVTLNFSGVAGLGYQLQRSTNAAAGWLTVLTTNAPVGGAFQWVDHFQGLPAFPGAAFYRLQEP